VDKSTKIDTLKKKIDKAKNYIQSEYKDKKWGYYKQLYQATITPVVGAATWRSQECVPLVYQMAQDTVGRIIRGLLGESGSEFFTVYPRLKKDATLKAKGAKALETIMRYHLDASNFGVHFHNAAINSLIYGIGWIKLWWLYDKQEYEYFDTKTGKVEKAKLSVVTDRPAFSAPCPNNVFFDDEAENYFSMNFAGETEFLTYDEIKAFKDKPGYDNSAINEFLDDKADAYENDPTERYEYDVCWTKKDVQGLLCGQYLIRDHINPIKSGLIRIPYFPLVYSPEPNQIIGRGLSQILASYQETASDIQNLTLDALYIICNPIFLKKMDSQIHAESLNLEPGSVIELDDVGDLARLDMGTISPQIFQELETVLSLANRVTGSAAGVMYPGTVQGEINNATATGATILQEEANVRFNYYIAYNRINCIKPMIKLMIDFEQQYLDPDKVEDMLGSKVMEAAGIEAADVDNSVEYDFMITGKEGMRGSYQDLQATMQAVQTVAALPDGANRLNIEAIIERVAKDLDMPKDFFTSAKGGMPIDVNKLTPNAKAQLGQLAERLGITIDALLERIASGERIEDIAAQGAESAPEAPDTEVADG
jgi:hypothetical protein